MTIAEHKNGPPSLYDAPAYVSYCIALAKSADATPKDIHLCLKNCMVHLFTDPRVDAAYTALLESHHFDPLYDDQSTLWRACHYNHKSVSTFLLQDSRTDPGAMTRNLLISGCVLFEHEADMCRALLRHPKMTRARVMEAVEEMQLNDKFGDWETRKEAVKRDELDGMKTRVGVLLWAWKFFMVE